MKNRNFIPDVVHVRDRGKGKRPRYWRVVRESWTRFYDEYSNDRRNWRRPEVDA